MTAEGTNNDLHLAEQRLAECEERLRSFFDNSFDAMLLISPDGAVYSANPQACRIFGMTEQEICSCGWEELVDEAVPSLQQALFERACHEIFRGEVTLRRKDGGEFPAELSMSMFKDRQGAAKASLIIRDISEQKRLEGERLRLKLRFQEMQRLESLSILAGGVAHDFNNVLQPIVGYVQLARMRSEPDHQVATYLEKIEQAAEKATQLAYRMLAYAGKWKFQFKAVAISPLLAGIQGVLSAIVVAPIELLCVVEPDLPAIEADPDQIGHAVKALVTNAAEAIGDNDGTITIRGGAMTANRSYLDATVAGEGLPTGEYVFVEVADTGCGMTPDIAAKIFDPFFTTKFIGRGLSLPAVLGIVRGHNGTIRVDSQPGEGTAFTLLFPRMSPPETQQEILFGN